MRQSRRIGIFGHYGNKNLGDEAVITAVCQNLRRLQPNVEFYGFSINPEDTRRRHGMAAFPVRRLHSAPRGGADRLCAGSSSPGETITKNAGGGPVLKIKGMIKGVQPLYLVLRRMQAVLMQPALALQELRFLMQSYRHVRKVDLFIVAGSGQLADDWGGPWGFPFTLFKWSFLAKLAGAKVAFLSVGAGPIGGRLSRFFIRSCARLADYMSLRDEDSRNVLERIGVKRELLVYPDMAHSLGLSSDHLRRSADYERARPTVGINPIPAFDGRYWPVNDEQKFGAYVQTLALLADALVSEGYPLFFFSTHPKDEPVIRDILARMKETDPRAQDEERLIRASSSVGELLGTIARADIVVASRFHGILLAQYLGRPVLAISNARKQNELMQARGQADYLLTLHEFRMPEALARFRMLEAARSCETARLEEKTLEYQAALEEQYRAVLKVIEP